MVRKRGDAGLLRRGILLALLGLAVLAVLHAGGLFNLPDLKVRDLWFRLRGERTASDRIAIVEIDDETISAYGGWPLSRDVYALLLVALEEAGATAVGFDLLFLGPDQHDPRYDALLASVTSGKPNVVHAVAFLSGAPAGGPSAGTVEGENLLASRHALEGASLAVPQATTVSLPYESLVDAAHAIGHTTVSVDADGAVRRLPPFVRYRGGVYPSLALRLAWFAFGQSDLPHLVSNNGAVGLLWDSGREFKIQLDDEGSTPINFAGGPGAFTNTYGMLEVLRWYSNRDSVRLENAFSERIVIVGNTAIGEAVADLGTTPFVALTPLVYAHAGFLDMVLRDAFLRFAPFSLGLLALAGLAVLLGFMFTRFSLPTAAILTGAVVPAVAAVEFFLFVSARLIVPNLMPLLLPPVAYGAVASYRYIFMERRVREHEKELKVARTIQMELLPAGPPSVVGLDVFGVNIPAKDVAGDYFDWIALPSGSLAVAVGDVSGKGVSSSLLMSHLHASLHAESRGSEDPREIIEAMNLSLSRAIEAHHFATFFLAVVCSEKHSIKYCNAGHSPVLLISGGEVRPLEPTGIPLGVFEETPYAGEDVAFGPADYLVICSDGVTESQHRDEFYGDDRLRALVGSIAGKNLTAKEAGEEILAGVRSFTGHKEYDDDVTVVVVRHE